MKTKFLLLFFSFFILLFSCKKEKPFRVIKITTDTIIEITDTSVIIQGTFIDIGDQEIEKWGFCWAENDTPLITDNKSENIQNTDAGIKEYNITSFIYNTHYWVRMYAITKDETYYSESLNFKTPTGFEITSPTDTTIWLKGTIQRIAWNSSFDDNIKLELINNNELELTIETNIKNEGFYFWEIPDDLSEGSNYQILVSNIYNPQIQTKSDFFSINNNTPQKFITITAPNNTSKWTIGKQEQITWDSNVEGKLKIELYKNQILTKTITTQTNNDGNFNYTPTQDIEPDNKYTVKITSLDDNTLFSISDEFEIKSLPNIEFDSYILIADYDQQSYSDGYIGKGETITLEISIININSAVAEDVLVTFTSSNSNIENLPTTQINFGNIAYNQIVSKEITFDIDNNAPCQQLFNIELEIEDKDGNIYSDNFNIQRICYPVVTRITLVEYPLTTPNGNPWDTGFGLPDIYFKLFENGIIIFDEVNENTVICDVGNYACWWDYQSPYFLPYLDKLYKFEFWDDDSGICNFIPINDPEFIGQAFIRISDFIEINGDNVTYKNLYNETGDITIELQCTWE